MSESKPLVRPDLEAMEKRCEAATPDWKSAKRPTVADFIASARDLPALIAYAKELEVLVRVLSLGIAFYADESLYYLRAGIFSYEPTDPTPADKEGGAHANEVLSRVPEYLRKSE